MALPESAAGRVDSAVLRWRHAGCAAREMPLAVTDTALEAEIGDLEPGPTEFEALAYDDGALAYRGETSLDPSGGAAAEVVLTLGKVGRIAVDADKWGGIE